MQKNETYKTSDLGLAAAIYLYLPQVEIVKAKNNRLIFAFPLTEKVTSIVESYWQRSLKIDALSYYTAEKHLKTQIHEILRKRYDQ